MIEFDDRRSASPAAGLSGGGLPFADSVQRAFGRHDISSVNVHVADAASPALQAQAFTAGEHVAFADGGGPAAPLGHEAAHVVQQRAGVDAFRHIAE